MKIVSVNELVEKNYSLTFINSLKQFWVTTKSFQCINAPKRENLFLLLVGCSARYVEKDGKITLCKSGDLVYAPKGSEYKVELFNFESEKSHTIGINFLIYDEDLKEICLSEGVSVIGSAKTSALENLFIETIKNNSLNDKKIALMQVFSALCEINLVKKFPKFIIDSVNYLNENLEYLPTVKELADRAMVSEVYFRKLFKECYQKSPVEYRNELRLNRAKSYLEHGEISIQEISDTLGYATVSHFIKEFKKRYGYSPLKFKKLSK